MGSVIRRARTIEGAAGGRAIIAALALAITLAALGLVGSVQPLHAAGPFTVDSFDDTIDADPGDGTCADSGDACTLRAAIMEANAFLGADVITLPAGTYTLTISGGTEDLSATGDLDILADLTINGAGAGTTIIDASALSDRAIEVIQVIRSTTSVTLRDLTVTGGSGLQGGGIVHEGTLVLVGVSVTENTTGTTGGGIHSRSGATLTLQQSTVTRNTSIASTRFGGGIYSAPTAALFLDESTVSGNIAGQGGGGIYSQDAELEIRNSTISGNTSLNGGGIAFHSRFGSGGFLLRNSTVSGNIASSRGGGVYSILSEGGDFRIEYSTITANSGGGISITTPDGTSPSMIGSIVAGNVSGADCASVSGSLGNNIDSDGTCQLLLAAGDQPNVDPKLRPLAGNDGPTFTHALLSDSPAIDAAGDCTGIITTDQRGVARPQGSACDIGAFEFVGGGGSPPPPDEDGDGVPDARDLCSGTGEEAVDADGCSASQLAADDDDDVVNHLDLCAGTLTGADVDADGCSVAQLDEGNEPEEQVAGPPPIAPPFTISVSKVVVELSAGAAPPADTRFEFSLVCNNGATNDAFSLAVGETFERPMLFGIACTLTETNSQGAVSVSGEGTDQLISGNTAFVVTNSFELAPVAVLGTDIDIVLLTSGPVTAGDQVSFQVDLGVTGGTLPDALLQQTFEADLLSFVSASINGVALACSGGGGAVTCELGTVSGAVSVLALFDTLGSTAGTVNTVVAIGQPECLGASPFTASATTRVAAQTACPAPVEIGPVSASLTVGQAAGPAVQVTPPDTGNAGLAGASGTSSPWALLALLGSVVALGLGGRRLVRAARR